MGVIVGDFSAILCNDESGDVRINRFIYFIYLDTANDQLTAGTWETNYAINIIFKK